MNAAAHLSDELLSAHIDAALGSEEAALVSAHLFTCSGCSDRRELLRATSHAVANLPIETPPRPVSLAFLHEEPKPKGFLARLFERRPAPWLYPAAGAAAVLVVALAVGPSMLQGSHSPGSGGAATASRSNGLANPLVQAPPAASSATADKSATQSGGAVPGPYAAALPNRAAPSATYTAPDGMRLTIQASTDHAAVGQRVDVSFEVVAGTRAVTLSSRGAAIRALSSTGDAQIAASGGHVIVLQPGERIQLSAEWTAGAGSDRTAAGAYTLVGSISLADGTQPEVRLPFTAS